MTHPTYTLTGIGPLTVTLPCYAIAGARPPDIFRIRAGHGDVVVDTGDACVALAQGEEATFTRERRPLLRRVLRWLRGRGWRVWEWRRRAEPVGLEVLDGM